jgi:hypothetical protein
MKEVKDCIDAKRKNLFPKVFHACTFGKTRKLKVANKVKTCFLFFRMSPARWGHPDGCPPAWPARNVKTEVENKVCMIRAGFCALRSGITLELLIISAPDLRTREK